MPRVKAMAAKYAKEDFVAEIRKAGIDAGCKSVAAMSRSAKINRGLLYRRLEDPDEMTLGEVRALVRMGLSTDAVSKFITYNN